LTENWLDNGNIRLKFLKTGDDLLEMEAIYRPGAPPPPAHFHPRQVEYFQVLSGALRFVIAGRERIASAGDRLILPPRTVHAVDNPGVEEARVLWQIRPALKTRQLFETLYRFERRPNLLQILWLSWKYRREMVLSAQHR
jgi:quercetin dioxygenase-like cupin family protein